MRAFDRETNDFRLLKKAQNFAANIIATASNILFTPSGGVSATDVQTAIAELDSDKAPKESPAFTGTPTAVSFKIGDATNNFEVKTNGTARLNGTATVFDDLVAATSGTVTSGPGVSVNGTELSIDFAATANLSDYAWTAYQLRHAWKAGSTINPHIHWEQASSNVPNFMMQYRWQINLSGKTTAWTNYKCNTPVATYVSGTLNNICQGAGIVPPVGYNISDILQVRVIRDSGNSSTLFAGADPYTGTVRATSFDCHLEFDALGSETEYTK